MLSMICYVFPDPGTPSIFSDLFNNSSNSFFFNFDPHIENILIAYDKDDCLKIPNYTLMLG